MSAKNRVDFNLIVNLNSGACKRSDIVGNKAKSLSLLKKAIAEGLIEQASFATNTLYSIYCTSMKE